MFHNAITFRVGVHARLMHTVCGGEAGIPCLIHRHMHETHARADPCREGR